MKLLKVLNILETLIKNSCNWNDIYKHQKKKNITKKKCSTITYEDLIEFSKTVVKEDKLHKINSGEAKTYFIVENLDSVFVPDTQNNYQKKSFPNNYLFNGNQEINLE